MNNSQAEPSADRHGTINVSERAWGGQWVTLEMMVWGLWRPRHFLAPLPAFKHFLLRLSRRLPVHLPLCPPNASSSLLSSSTSSSPLLLLDRLEELDELLLSCFPQYKWKESAPMHVKWGGRRSEIEAAVQQNVCKPWLDQPKHSHTEAFFWACQNHFALCVWV